MSPVQRVLLLVLSLTFLVEVFRLVSRGRLRLKYSLLWLAMGLALIVCAVFPGAVGWLSRSLGFGLSSNFVFFVALVCLLGVTLSLTVIVSKQATMIRSLVQQVALLKKQVGDPQDAAGEGPSR